MSWHGLDDEALCTLLGAPLVRGLDEVTSTLDIAHELAATGAPAGSVVVADRQTQGRGRSGRSWASEPGRGVWMTYVARPRTVEHLGVVSIRVGLALSRRLDAYAADSIALKWPNDLFVGDRKLAGILAEARWRDAMPDWMAVGIGVNVALPSDVDTAASLTAGSSRVHVLRACVDACREATAEIVPLSPAELSAYRARDWARGRTVIEPYAGVVEGINAEGALLVRDDRGLHELRAGSLRVAP